MTSSEARPPLEQAIVVKDAAPSCASSSIDAISSASASPTDSLSQQLRELSEAIAETELDPLQELCEAWAGWVRTRRFYKPPSLPPSILGRLTSKSPTRTGTGPEAWNSAELSALNEAIEAEPIEAIDRQVFELHYRHRVKGIKIFAAALGISRSHWYNLLRSFEQRVHAASLEIRERNEAARQALRSYDGNQAT